MLKVSTFHPIMSLPGTMRTMRSWHFQLRINWSNLQMPKRQSFNEPKMIWVLQKKRIISWRVHTFTF
jgi:hypothetical protein